MSPLKIDIKVTIISHKHFFSAAFVSHVIIMHAVLTIDAHDVIIVVACK